MFIYILLAERSILNEWGSYFFSPLEMDLNKSQHPEVGEI